VWTNAVEMCPMAEARRPRGQLRDDILDVTARLIAERGDPTSVSIDDVVRAVDCTPPSLYYYFPSKDHLVYASCQRQYERFAAAVADQLWATVHGGASPAVVNPDLPRELAEATLEHNAAAVLRYQTAP
jgi:AcrR family transcriptional regulator